ncbi:hypothetical protein PInf_019825 [Phytophthora infestans]|nr:hypothetical protein PInf_019825 [Phytophthora infestans]
MSDRALVRHVPTSVRARGPQGLPENRSIRHMLESSRRDVYDSSEEALIVVALVKWVAEAQKQASSASDVDISTSSDVGNEVPRRGRRRRRRHKLGLNLAQTDVALIDSASTARAPQTRLASGIPLETLPKVSEMLALKEMLVEDLLVDLKAREIAEMVLIST